MPKANPHPADISVIVAKNGHVLVFQGFFHQALFILREHVPRFLENPQQAAMLVIPPFAATALSCYTAMEECTSISLTRDLSLGDEFTLVITTSRGPKIAYYADHEAPIGPRSLARQGIGIAITPMAVTTLDQSGSSPSLSLVAGIQQPQVPDYSMRFAADPNIIKEAVRDALSKINPTQRYAT
jgi:hypothetical protein